MVTVNNASVLMQTMVYLMNQSFIQQESSYNYYLLQIGEATNAKKCYGVYGCFELAAPWTSEHRPVSLFPEELEKIEPRYPLYNRENLETPYEIDLSDPFVVENSEMDPRKPLYVVSHGYMEGGGASWIIEMVHELLKHEDCNVIVVDWHGGSGPPYTQAVANTRLVGAITAHLLGEIAKHTGNLKVDHVHLIGHSLGAHMSGYVGYTLQKEFNLTLGRITGLDPAEPHFAKAQPPVRLDRTAAQYVDIVHTDASQFIRGGLGITETIGHVDYFPNGGNDQPGCGKSVVQYINDEKGSFFRGVRKYLGCNHLRSHEFFSESINGDCSFLTISCSSYKDFLDGKCFKCGARGTQCLRFGFHGKKHYDKIKHKVKKGTSLVQYFMTSDQKPFCRGHYLVHVKVSNSKESVLHGGEIGQLLFTMHNSTDGKGAKSEASGFISGYHGPGDFFKRVIVGKEVKPLKAIQIEWKYNSSLFNPLTWRLLSTPKIYIEEIIVEALEIGDRIRVCPKKNVPLIHGIPQLLIPSYC